MDTMDRFDPRKHSSVVLSYNEKLPGVSAMSRTSELPVKTLVVGPHVRHSDSGTHRRPNSAPTIPTKKSTDNLSPRFLDGNGRWIAGQLPDEPRPTQSQAITASATMTAQVRNSMIPKKNGAVRPVSAVHSYADISPVITGEFVRDAGGSAHMTYTLGGKLTVKPSSPAGSPRSILDSRGHSPRLELQVPTSPNGSRHPFDAPQTPSPKAASRPVSAPRSPSVKPGQGNYMLVGMRSRGPSEAGKLRPASAVPVGSMRLNSRSGSRPHHTGHWTSLEPQADTMLKPGYAAVPLDHPLHLGNTGNPSPYDGGQYTLHGGNMASQYAGGGAHGHAGGAAAVTSDVHYTNGPSRTVGISANGPYAASYTNAYWPAPSVNSLGRDDLERVQDLGKGVVPGAANARLIGGKWKVVPRPTDGDIVYTDYYGPYGEEMANYYGRSYHMNTAEFAKHKLVNDSAYTRVRASMMGIQSLRDRPGLSMDSTLVHGVPEELQKINQSNAGKHYRHLHHIKEYHNIEPANRAVYPVA